jgi:hypothetical protein
MKPIQEILNIQVSKLKLWSENPRDPLENNATDYEIISRAIADNRKWNLQKLINEMGEYYDYSELPTVVEIKGIYTVLDGNRRVAVLKYLQDEALYQKLGGGLFFAQEPTSLKNQTTVACNVCDLETALTNIERKHINENGWGHLERDYFLMNFRNKPKSLFIQLEEQTKAISSNPILNQRFVKEEVLTRENLKELGFELDLQSKIVSNYTQEKQKEIIDAVVDLLKNKVIDTRNNRGELVKPLKARYPRIEIQPYSPKKKTIPINLIDNHKPVLASFSRKTARTKSVDILFGEKLFLKSGKVNDLYRALDDIYEKNKRDEGALQVIGMSLRLIIEVAARVHFEEKDPIKANKDMIYKDFLKQAKQDMALNQASINYLSLTTSWLNGDNSIEALLGKYAHGNIATNKEDVLKSSKLIGEILKFYFSK